MLGGVSAVPSGALTDVTLLEAVAELSVRDRHLAAVAERWGPPPLWAREPGFATLVRIILEQQVSLASAQAAFDRLRAATGSGEHRDGDGDVAPSAFLGLDDAQLLAIGFSRQKARYARLLARAVLDGTLDLHGLGGLDDREAYETLVAQTGIGPWTASIYQLMVLRRPDVWPASDIALQTALAEVKDLAARPDAATATALAEPWRPYRAVGARLLWHAYLRRRGR